MQAAQQQTGRDQGRHRLPYQAGLDGLRALAVAGVFLYHANVGWMPGGFLGVDLFFVLSGYLITSLLLNEFSRRGAIDLAAFWGRRARRLLPAVALVILFALLATVTIARDDLGRTRADALSALVYLTNWHEVIASHSYFNQFGRPSLLQHLWSLAVEEQFYVFWPLLLIGGLRWLRRGTMVALTAALAAGSCALMWLVYNPSGDPSRVYYGTDTRAFTLLIGALLAFALPLGTTALRGRPGGRSWLGAGRWLGARSWLGDASRLGARSRLGGRVVVDVIGVAALAGVLVLFARVQDFDPWLYQGGFLLMAVVAAVLVAAVSQPEALLGRALGRGPLRWLGARSYGIYLWHWPIMQLTRPWLDVPLHGAPLILGQAVATTAAAALSYRYVEMPVRTGAAQRRAKAWLDRRTPHQRLAWVSGTAAAIVTLAGIGFGLPAPTPAAASQATATSAARRALPPTRPLSPGLTGSDTTWEAQLIGAVRGSSATRTAVGAGNGGGAVGGENGGAVGGAVGGGKRGAQPSRAILAVGDSVMLGCAPNLEQRLGHGLRVDAVVGRQAEATIARLAQYRAAGQLPATVIVQIGDNGPVWYADMQHLRRVLRGVTHVVLVNVRVARSWQNEVNSELKSYARSWPQAVIANWYEHSSAAMLSDGVHPWISDRGVYASVVVAALKESERARPDAGSRGQR